MKMKIFRGLTRKYDWFKKRDNWLRVAESQLINFLNNKKILLESRSEPGRPCLSVSRARANCADTKETELGLGDRQRLIKIQEDRSLSVSSLLQLENGSDNEQGGVVLVQPESEQGDQFRR